MSHSHPSRTAIPREAGARGEQLSPSMANRARATSINHLPDELLSRIISLATTAATSAKLTAELDGANETGTTGEPNFTDGPGFSNLAVVCKRWMLLMTILRVRGGFKSKHSELRGPELRAMTLSAPAISAPALFRALALAPRVTALSLEANAVDFYDDEFLSRLLSARPQLARLSIAPPRFTGAPHFRIGTKAVENFFRVASSRLQELSLRECLGHTTKLPASVASLSSLRVFRLCSKVLRSLLDEMCRLSALQELYLSCPLLQQLPETFGRLKSLEHLSFTDFTEMRRLPDSLGDLSSLTSLHVDGSWQVDRFPPRVGALQQMRRLELRNFTGASLPDACEKWAKLENVTLDSCADMGAFQLASVHSLTHLTISACYRLQSLPPNLPFASALRHLTIGISVFPGVSLETLSNLVSLERLEVSSVDPTERFPEALFALPSLAYVKTGYVSWVEADHVAAMEEARELAALFAYPAPYHPTAAALAAAAATATAAATAAAAAAAGGGETGSVSPLGPSLKHLSMCFGNLLYGRRGDRLSARLCSLLSLTHLSIDCLSSSSLLPSDLGHLSNLRSLSLHGSWLCLPNSLSRLAPCLHSLKLHYSGDNYADTFRRDLPSCLARLTSLTHLHLCNMHVPSPPPALARLRALRTLRIEYDSGGPTHVSLPQNLGQLAALEWLELKDCSVGAALPQSFCDLSVLWRLYLSSDSLKRLPKEIAKLSRLEELTLGWCMNLETLSSGFGRLGALKKLSIRIGRNDYLPDTLSGLSSLEELSLSDCSHSFSLPPSFCLLPHLRTLALTSCNDLTTLPSNFGSLCSLQRLSVDSCKKFQHLPDSFSALSSLTFLTISKCPVFSSLPETFGLLPRLTRLRIVECDSFTHLPGSFSSLPALREACFSLCKQLYSLPPTLGKLPRLEVLQLRKCEALKSLPESLRQVRALRHVDVYGCGVSEKGVEESQFSELRSIERREMTLSAPAISAPALFRTMALVPSVTALSLEANAVDFYDDEFLSRLISARPQLARLSIAPPRFTGAPHFRIGTKSLENFFRVASSRLQELSLLECLGHTTKLPAFVASLSSLRVFRLCSKVLRSLPDEMCQLSSLQELYLNCPLLQQLHENFGQLKSLEHLSFTDCTEMRRLPDLLGDLSSLTSLHVDGSWQVDRFPPRVGALQQMRRLELRKFNGALPHAKSGRNSSSFCVATFGYGSRRGTISPRLCSLLSLTHLSIDGLYSSVSLPSDLGHLTNLRSLSLRGAWLCLPRSLSRLAPCLHSLTLQYSNDNMSVSFNRMLPSFLTDLTSLSHLHLHNMDLPSPPPGFARLRALRTLRIECDSEFQSRVALPEDLGQLAALEWLELRGCFLIDGIPSSLCDLASLRRLFLNSENLKHLPTAISNLSSLEELTIIWCHRLEALPPGFGLLRALKKLSVHGGSKDYLPDTLAGLSSLEEVSLAHCSRGFSLAPSLCLLPRLRTLTLTSCNDLTTLPAGFGSLCSLQCLSIDSCMKFHHLPDSFSTLPSLTLLSISNCPEFYSLPENHGLLPRLTRIKIVECDSFLQLPGSFSSLPVLRLACFSLCKQLHSLPPTLGLLPRLEVLQLREGEALKSLPESLRQVRALRHVDVYGCGVSEKGVEEVGFCGKQVHVVWGRMGKAEHVGWGRRTRGRRGEDGRDVKLEEG
ncbi:unnamed protein product [Closterium sp. Naga37s-1]|nr:unnamed protein product [Closterium sp. Naga37s-1]